MISIMTASKSRQRFTPATAIVSMRSYSRDIIVPSLAYDWADAFGVPHSAFREWITYREAGDNWNTRESVYEAGESIGAFVAAEIIADHVGAPEVEYHTDYMGTGKRAAACMEKACRRLEAYRHE